MSKALHHVAPETDPTASDTTAPSDATELLSVIGDEYARVVLRTLGDNALTAREITDRVDASRATVYRRLNRLTEIGVVETSMAYDANGHHRTQFRVTVDGLWFEFGDRITVDTER
jgi:DNA-binding HxlR family transcriptional regulator